MVPTQTVQFVHIPLGSAQLEWDNIAPPGNGGRAAKALRQTRHGPPLNGAPAGEHGHGVSSRHQNPVRLRLGLDLSLGSPSPSHDPKTVTSIPDTSLAVELSSTRQAEVQVPTARRPPGPSLPRDAASASARSETAGPASRDHHAEASDPMISRPPGKPDNLFRVRVRAAANWHRWRPSH
jgi:hypothetical protein